MKSEDIFDGVTDIRDDLIDGAKEAPKKQRHWQKKYWLGTVAAVLALAITGGIFLYSGGGDTGHHKEISRRPGDRDGAGTDTDRNIGDSSTPRQEADRLCIAKAEYPEMASYPDESAGYSQTKFDAWWNDVQAQRRDLGDISPLQSFFGRSTQTFLGGAEGENRVYSPLNVYMALSMLAQLTDGESREQILDLLGSDSMDALRQQASDVWNSNYRNDGALTSILAGSLWLNKDVKFNQDTIDILARDFYASSYQGEMGSNEFNQALQNWLNEQTGGLLKEQAGNIKLDRDTILALATTVYYKARWSGEFLEEDTAPQTFHTPDGDIETDFMYQEYDQDYFWGDKFAAVSQYFAEGGEMWFLLPDKEVSPEELLADSEAMDFLFTADKYDWEKQKFLIVNKSIPKFDVSSQFDLGKGLQALGVTDIFDPVLSDFTPVTTDVKDPIVLSEANHAARVVIDEEGCTAIAFTVMTAAGAPAPPDEKVDFVLDRPFLFCITGNSGLPLFVGIVNYPAGN